MGSIEEICRVIDTKRESVIRIQGALSARPALGPDNGGTGEHEKAAYVQGLLRALSPDVLDMVRVPDPRAADGYRPNLVALWKGREEERRVWILTHLDIVPPGDLSLWHGDPYRIRVEGDRVIGRGVEDNQQGFVSAYLALASLLERGGRPGRTVGLALVADEETGSAFGLAHLLENHPELFRPEDLIVVPDVGNEEGTMIEVSEKSMFWVRFTVLGKQCHGSTPHKGKNSLFGAAKAICALEGLKQRFPTANPLFSPPTSTFEPTKKEANVPNVNTIPGRDVFYLDCRVLPEIPLERVHAEMTGITEAVAADLGLSIAVEPVYRQDAAPATRPDAPVVRALQKAIRAVTGKEARPMGIGGGTVAAFFRRAGFPAAVWYTGSDSAHQPNEFSLISNTLADAKVFARLYEDDLVP